MANQEHVEMLLHDGVKAWNRWRFEESVISPDLSVANLSKADLEGANLRNVDLRSADLIRANLRFASLAGADLSGADLTMADMFMANLSGADFEMAKLYLVDLRSANLYAANFSGAWLREANLRGTNFYQTDLREANLMDANLTRAHVREANLTGANLSGASCLHTDFAGATLAGCNVYGISAWDVKLEGATQADLYIPSGDSYITVDNLEVAQFLYLLLHNEKMRAVLDTITSKVVLILGRFSDERKPVLDALREALRSHPNGYIPVLFDFEPQTERHVLDTVKTLANLARFVIADLTDPHVVRTELALIVPTLPDVPVQPIVQRDAELPLEYTWWRKFPAVLPVQGYVDLSDLLANLNASVIAPVEAHVHARRL